MGLLLMYIFLALELGIMLYLIAGIYRLYLRDRNRKESFRKARNFLEANKDKYLCSICRLRDICIDFDYECVEASDFLFKPETKTYTVKDVFLNNLIDKDNKALRG